ncbi:MAG: peptidoglycan editing factor PgeF [Vicinamibacterales bacterium]
MSLPKPSGEFEWVQESWGAALRCRPLETVARHSFSTRDLALGGAGADDPESWKNLAHALGVEVDSLARLRQVHCAGVFEAKQRLVSSAFPDWPEADIAVTDDPAIALSVKAADCVPILLADRRSGAIAAVHAGWKGTAEGAAMVAVRALTSRYDTKPEDIVAAAGPCIGPCCYEVGPDLASHFSSHPEAPNWFTRDAKPHLDLWRATREQLARAGVPGRQIHVCELCTFDHPALFHSYRRDGRNAGRLVAAIRSAPGRTP